GGRVAFGELGSDELRGDRLGFLPADGLGGLGAGLERGSAPAVGEGDVESIAGRFDVGLIDFVGVSLAVVQGGGHWFVGVGLGWPADGRESGEKKKEPASRSRDANLIEAARRCSFR